jgi:hypothetical protein
VAAVAVAAAFREAPAAAAADGCESMLAGLISPAHAQ